MMMKICLLCSHNVENDDDDDDDDKEGKNNNDDKEGDNNNDVCRKNLGDLIPRHMQIFKANEFFCGLRSRS